VTNTAEMMGGQPAQPYGRGGTDPAEESARAALGRLRAEIGKVIVGQDATVTGLVLALLCRGHVLLEGVPGVAKTLLIRTMAASLALDAKRTQFTPDLMPSDVTGSLVFDSRTAAFEFRPGPVFTNLYLADEINRTPPKTQASLLEVMEERQVSVDGRPRPLPEPFLVAATMNPIEYEGTYPLPEAQLDRFLFKLTVPLPTRDEELGVLRAHHHGFDPRDLATAGVSPVAGAADLAAARKATMRVQVADVVAGLRGGPVPGHPQRPLARTGRLPPRRDRSAQRGQGVRLADGARLRHPRRRQGGGPTVLRHRIRLRHEADWRA
jgi:MoxR-like ATPase